MAQTTVTRPTQNINALSNQWRSRPDDERYTSLADLHRAVASRRDDPEFTGPIKNLRLQIVPPSDPEDPTDLGQLALALSGAPEGAPPLAFSNYSFGQLCSIAGAPASYLRGRPAKLVEMDLAWDLGGSNKASKLLLSAPDTNYFQDPDLAPTDDDLGHWGRLRALTSPTYGRIWDQDVVEAVMAMNARDERWVIPSATYTATDPKRATTLYASDRDVFMFLCDPKNVVEVDGEQLYRGFMVWNSEVGNATFGLRTMLYRYVCDNRIIWNASTVDHITIRHTSGGPQRFADQAVPALQAYADGSTSILEKQIHSAKQLHVGRNANEVTEFLKKRGFGNEQAKVAVNLAEREEGDPTSLWAALQGLTAYARTIPHTDARVEFEMKAGNLLSEVAN